MAGSRLEKLGTIFGRVTGLIRGGALKREDKPLWYDVYQVFRPKIEPSYGATRPMPEVRKIFYPEDTIRAKLHQKMKWLPAENLYNATTTHVTKQIIELTWEILRENGSLTEQQALDKAIRTLKKKGILDFRKLREPRAEKEKANKNVPETSESGNSEVLQASATEESTNSGETRPRSLAGEYVNAMKNISEKNVDISKINKDDK